MSFPITIVFRKTFGIETNFINIGWVERAQTCLSPLHVPFPMQEPAVQSAVVVGSKVINRSTNNLQI